MDPKTLSRVSDVSAAVFAEMDAMHAAKMLLAFRDANDKPLRLILFVDEPECCEAVERALEDYDADRDPDARFKAARACYGALKALFAAINLADNADGGGVLGARLSAEMDDAHDALLGGADFFDGAGAAGEPAEGYDLR